MITAAVAFGLLGLVCVGLIVVGLPGTWILLAVAVVMELADAAWAGPGAVTFGWWPLAGGLAVAGAGELMELATGAMGSKVGGGTRRGMIGAVLGGMVGGLLGTFLLPLLGTLLGAILGTFVGALIGETTGAQARETRQAIKPALTATIGRVLGTVLKVIAAMVVWAGLLGVMIWRLAA